MILKGIALNVLYSIPPIRRRLTAADYNPKETVDQMAAAARDKVQWLRDRLPEGVSGKTIVELGPGGDFALEIALVGLGAARTITIDRDASYLPKQSTRVSALYPLMASEFGVRSSGNSSKFAVRSSKTGLRTPNFELRTSESELRTSNSRPFWHPPLSSDQFQYLVGKGIEREDRIPAGSVDVICSFAVLEHLPRLDRAFEAMRRLLKPGGWMIHKVDLRDHTDFSRPLEFLRYPEWLWVVSRWKWSYMNRARWSVYPPLLAAHGFRLVERWPTRTLSDDELAAQRPRLARRFRRLTPDDLRLLGVGFTAQKIG